MRNLCHLQFEGEVYEATTILVFPGSVAVCDLPS